jgi:hypothetical protein
MNRSTGPMCQSDRVRPPLVTEGDEMLAPERPLAASGRLIEWRSKMKL